MSQASKPAAAGATRPKVVVERTYKAPIEEPWALWTTKVVTLDPMHDEEFTRMSTMGFNSQLTKLDRRFGREGS